MSPQARKPRSNLTPSRRAWLEELRDKGWACRHRGRTGYDCMKIGWTEWRYVDKESRRSLTKEEMQARFTHSNEWFEKTDIAGERLTEAGRKALEEL